MTQLDPIHGAARDLLLAEFESATDLHEWLGKEPDAGKPFHFALERWHRTVGKVSWRLQLISRDFLLSMSTRLDIADPLFPEKAVAWMREQTNAALLRGKLAA